MTCEVERNEFRLGQTFACNAQVIEKVNYDYQAVRSRPAVQLVRIIKTAVELS